MEYTVKILSPAKINLMLRILGQRDDGYHLLQTYFQLLNWGDEMNFTLTSNNLITIDGNFGSLRQKDNLIDKAARLLLPYRKKNFGINIQINKIIPQGSGLGGGSSNAGTTLRVLNDLWKCNLSQNNLQEMALTIGADVPIFVLNQSAMATGVGEKFEPFEIQPYYYVLIFPNVSISTADVFGERNLYRSDQLIESQKIHSKNYWTNTCLELVLNKFPQVNTIYSKLSKFTPIYLSGTGSTLFSCFETKREALDFIKLCPSNTSTIVCNSKINEKK